jgi:hypothetical protein
VSEGVRARAITRVDAAVGRPSHGDPPVLGVSTRDRFCDGLGDD